MRALTLLLLSFLVPMAYAAPERLGTFDTLMSALKQGREVRVVIEYAKMKLTEEGKEVAGPEAIGGMTIGEWEYFAKGVVRNTQPYVAFSETVLINHPGYGWVQNYVRLRVFADGSVEVTAKYLKPADQTVVMDETFKGAIAGGKDDKGVAFFAER